jgi:hypothetical protein
VFDFCQLKDDYTEKMAAAQMFSDSFQTPSSSTKRQKISNGSINPVFGGQSAGSQTLARKAKSSDNLLKRYPLFYAVDQRGNVHYDKVCALFGTFKENR